MPNDKFESDSRISPTVFVDTGLRRISEMSIAMKNLLHEFVPPTCFKTTIEMRDSDEKISVTFEYVHQTRG